MENNVNYDDTLEIDLKAVLTDYVHKLWLVVLLAIVGGAAGYLICTFLINPVYQSTTSVYVLSKTGNNSITYSDVQLGSQLTKDYAQLIKSRYVMERVIDEYGLNISYDKMCAKVSVTTPSDTRMLMISVTDADPQLAHDMANSIRIIASKQIESVMDIEAVNVVDEANIPDAPISPNISRNTKIGILTGFVLASIIIIFSFLFDDSIKTAEDVEKYLGLSTLAIIPVMGEEKSDSKSKRKRKKADNAKNCRNRMHLKV